MKKFFFLFILILAAACGDSSDNFCDTCGPQVDEVAAGIVEPSKLQLVSGDFFLDINFEVRSDNQEAISTRGEAFFRKAGNSTWDLAASFNSHYCSVTTGSDALDGGGSNGSNTINAGLLTVDGVQEILPVVASYDLDSLNASLGDWLDFAFAPGSQEIDGINQAIPAIEVDLYVPDPGVLTLNGADPGEKIQLKEVSQLRWTPIGKELHEKFEERLVFTNQKVVVTARDGLGDSMGSLKCSLYSTESTLAAALEDEGIDVEEVIKALDGDPKSLTFRVEQYYRLGELIESNGGIRALLMGSKSFTFEVD